LRTPQPGAFHPAPFDEHALDGPQERDEVLGLGWLTAVLAPRADVIG
jgi:hypothetical protein